MIDEVQTGLQIYRAMTGKKVSTPKYKPEWLQNRDKVKAIWESIIETIYAIWNTMERPTLNRHEIVPKVQEKINMKIEQGIWPESWAPPGRDSIVRRLNECAHPENFPDNTAPIISIGKGRYLPNPLKFTGETRTRLLEIIESK